MAAELTVNIVVAPELGVVPVLGVVGAVEALAPALAATLSVVVGANLGKV